MIRKSIEGLKNEEADDPPNLVSFRISEDEQVVWFTFSDKRMALAALVKEDEECIFDGKFNDDEFSRVLVTGCRGDERNIMIQSPKFGDTLAIGRNGLIETVRWNNLHSFNVVQNQRRLHKGHIGRNLKREK